MCQCFQIGGPFIAEDPNCPVHGVNAQQYDEEIEQLRAEVAAWRNRFPDLVYRRQDDVVSLRMTGGWLK